MTVANLFHGPPVGILTEGALYPFTRGLFAYQISHFAIHMMMSFLILNYRNFWGKICLGRFLPKCPKLHFEFKLLIVFYKRGEIR